MGWQLFSVIASSPVVWQCGAFVRLWRNAGNLMVKIRYSDLPAGLHVIAESDRRGTVVYLLPGLTSAQRRAALGRVRSSSRMGQGPALPATAMAAAIAADRVRTTARTGAAAMRGHPVLFLPPLIAVVVSGIAFMLISAVPVTAATHDKAAASLPTLPVGSGSPSVGHRHHPHHRGSKARHRGGPGPHRLAGLASASTPSPSGPGRRPA
jgi:hypothetical protein